MDEWERLDSHPHIAVQTMIWQTKQIRLTVKGRLSQDRKKPEPALSLT